MDSLYYCPISARLSSSSFELLTPSDTPIQRFEPSADTLRAALASANLSVGTELDAATDAAFAAFSMNEGGAALVSRVAYGADDLERITDELLIAAGRPDLSGILRSLVTPEGHVIVVVDYLPTPSRVTSEERAEALVADLHALHDAELLHGGINERFMNPEAAAGRRVFGVGLSEAYAAWRRSQSLAIGELRADPRFASPSELRGEPASVAGDQFALVAAILCEIQDPGEANPALDAVQGINALLERARQRDVLIAIAQRIGDKRVREYLIGMMGPKRTADPRVWRIAMLAISGLSALMLLWLVIPSGKMQDPPPAAPVAVATAVECAGGAVSVVDGLCEPSEGYGRCGAGTIYDGSSKTCVLDDAEMADVEEALAEEMPGAEPITGGPHIHPVLACEEGQRRVEGRFSFGNDDLRFTPVERSQLARIVAQCGGPASVVYYLGKPDLESRAHTTFDEYRSSTSCGSRCREAMPADPTAVLYIPYIGRIERSMDHYLFFHCCAD